MAEDDREPIRHRYDFVYFFDVTDGNPNGDPDAGGLPRVDPETGHGLVTDVCLKRKIRNYVATAHGEKPPFEIYVKERAALNSQHDKAWEAVSPETKKADRNRLPKDEKAARELTRWMCHNFFDIRSFGAVMTTEVNCGQVRGPIQLGIARSIDPIAPQEYAITRCAVTNERDIEKERTFGRKFAVPYALYRVHGYVNPCLAAQTMFSDEDLALFRQAIGQMFEYDRSANRGQMCPRKCVAFRHESKLGNARADQLFALVKATLKSELRETERPPRKFEDYVLSVDEANVPKDIYLEQWI